MILIVVKHPVRPEYADNWPSLVKRSPRPHGLSPATSASTGSEVSKTQISMPWSRPFRTGQRGKRTSTRITFGPR